MDQRKEREYVKYNRILRSVAVRNSEIFDTRFVANEIIVPNKLNSKRETGLNEVSIKEKECKSVY